MCAADVQMEIIRFLVMQSLPDCWSAHGYTVGISLCNRTGRYDCFFISALGVPRVGFLVSAGGRWILWRIIIQVSKKNQCNRFSIPRWRNGKADRIMLPWCTVKSYPAYTTRRPRSLSVELKPVCAVGILPLTC